MKGIKKICIVTAVAMGIFAPGVTYSAAAPVESPTEVTSPVQENHVLVVEYFTGQLSSQQAVIEELTTKGLAVPLASESLLKSFELVVHDPVYNILHQGTAYRKEYPVGMSSERQNFEVTTPIMLDEGRVCIPEGFLMEFYVERGKGSADVIFHAIESKKETIPGNTSVSMRDFHSAGNIKVYPSNCVAVTNIDGKGGFLLFSYRQSRKF